MFVLKPEPYKPAYLAVLKSLSTFHEEHLCCMLFYLSIFKELFFCHWKTALGTLMNYPLHQRHFLQASWKVSNVPWKYLILHKPVEDTPACAKTTGQYLVTV